MYGFGTTRWLYFWCVLGWLMEQGICVQGSEGEVAVVPQHLNEQDDTTEQEWSVEVVWAARKEVQECLKKDLAQDLDWLEKKINGLEDGFIGLLLADDLEWLVWCRGVLLGLLEKEEGDKDVGEKAASTNDKRNQKDNPNDVNNQTKSSQSENKQKVADKQKNSQIKKIVLIDNIGAAKLARIWISLQSHLEVLDCFSQVLKEWRDKYKRWLSGSETLDQQESYTQGELLVYELFRIEMCLGQYRGVNKIWVVSRVRFLKQITSHWLHNSGLLESIDSKGNVMNWNDVSQIVSEDMSPYCQQPIDILYLCDRLRELILENQDCYLILSGIIRNIYTFYKNYQELCGFDRETLQEINTKLEQLDDYRWAIEILLSKKFNKYREEKNPPEYLEAINILHQTQAHSVLHDVYQELISLITTATAAQFGKYQEFPTLTQVSVFDLAAINALLSRGIPRLEYNIEVINQQKRFVEDALVLLLEKEMAIPITQPASTQGIQQSPICQVDVLYLASNGQDHIFSLSSTPNLPPPLNTKVDENSPGADPSLAAIDGDVQSTQPLTNSVSPTTTPALTPEPDDPLLISPPLNNYYQLLASFMKAELGLSEYDPNNMDKLECEINDKSESESEFESKSGNNNSSELACETKSESESSGNSDPLDPNTLSKLNELQAAFLADRPPPQPNHTFSARPAEYTPYIDGVLDLGVSGELIADECSDDIQTEPPTTSDDSDATPLSTTKHKHKNGNDNDNDNDNKNNSPVGSNPTTALDDSDDNPGYPPVYTLSYLALPTNQTQDPDDSEDSDENEDSDDDDLLSAERRPPQYPVRFQQSPNRLGVFFTQDYMRILIQPWGVFCYDADREQVWMPFDEFMTPFTYYRIHKIDLKFVLNSLKEQ
ncbi:hypothetical protein NEHOM01_1507 [Nematocida homosporus]|uniref:uncharacterized protein n=1 Tax=Nematocida homosporus TaxID=1912981 RepID=UPI0022207BD7|nr:uncharacterized protein NEHOM01_1507 [Nematocida homosporus]KAI5186495.1 hypothetical protein NEHOM01_1507 [Nematocida homosporus]